MIATEIEKDPEIQDSCEKLAKYVAGLIGADKGEKLEDFWIVNSAAGESFDDLELAIIDIKNTQKMNTTAKSQKNYHMVISFKDEKPSLKALKDIEQEMAKALGFSEHQRVVGTHYNTGNFHMHIAFNKIHPETYNIHIPFQAYSKMSTICRKMEKKYNLAIDNGFEKTKEPGYEKPNKKAKDFEAKTWEQSFSAYVKENKEELEKGLKKAKNWQELHETFAKYDMEIKRKGNGAVITTKNGKGAIKASELSRNFSKAKLEEVLGQFQAPSPDIKIEPIKTYERKPLTKHKDTPKLWKKFNQEKKEAEALKKQGKSYKKKFGKKVYKSWKAYLLNEAYHDPLAAVIVYFQNKMIKALFSHAKMNDEDFKVIERSKADNGYITKEEREKNNKRCKEIMKNGINSPEDEKFLKEEKKRLEESIEFFEKNGANGDWASQKKARIEVMLILHNTPFEEREKDVLQKAEDGKFVKVDRQTAEYMGAFDETLTIDDVERARGKDIPEQNDEMEQTMEQKSKDGFVEIDSQTAEYIGAVEENFTIDDLEKIRKTKTQKEELQQTAKQIINGLEK
jgi:hypothetical protein